MSITQLLFSFNGRIRRTNYWLGAIGAGFALTVVMVVLFVICGAGIAALFGAGGNNSGAQAGGIGLAIVGVLLFLALMFVAMWITLALQIKRWHDRDKAWTWIFINLIPGVGAVWTLVECGFMDGTMGPNRFGPSPKGIVGPPPIQPAAPVAT